MKFKRKSVILLLILSLNLINGDPTTQLMGKTNKKIKHSKKNSPKSIYPDPIQIEAHPTVTYTIDAQLFPEEKKLLGTETIEWINKSRVPADSFRFHLYYNAFKHEKTTFLKELKFFKKTDNELKKYQYGEIKINEIRIVEGEELTHKIRYVAPDDQNPYDQTVMEIKLKEPIQPLQFVIIKINYTLLIPKLITRTGWIDDYFFLGQWFPKIGVFQNDGNWNCHQYHKNSEFFSDFGNYEVTITLPEKFIIGATGNLERKTKNTDGTYSFVFKENNIHDFAWVAYPFFKEIIEKIKLKGNRDETKIVLLMSPHHQKAKQLYLNTLKFALQYYADNISPYPYKKITLVDPPFKVCKSGNMEYPTLISTTYFKIIPEKFKLTESKIFHEFGHQYWYGIVGNDESREAWLDEGINTFFEMEIADQYFKNAYSFIDSKLLKINTSQYYRWKYISLPSVDKINQYSWSFIDSSSFERNVYLKTGIFLRSLRNYTGEKKMLDFFKFYAHKFKFKHPTTKDFIETFNQYMGEDFSWAFDQFINSNVDLDQAVYSIESIPIKKNPPRFKNTVIFIRKEGYFPVELIIRLQDGREKKYFWKEKENWRKFIFEDSSPIDYAVLDPNLKIPMDKNIFNNSKFLRTSFKGLNRISVKLGFHFQNLLSLIFL